MKNQMAVDVLNRMRRKGLDPTPEDVIRLNAFGLRVDEAQGKRADRSASLLPRVAVLVNPETGEHVVIRQPTIGHEIWLKSVMRLAEEDDLETILAVNMFALSRPASELPDACDPSSVQKSLDSFAKCCAPFTRSVVLAATYYARFGIDAASGEEPPAETDAERESAEEEPTPDSCVAVGSLVNGVGLLWGLPLSDIKAMTREQLDAACRTAIVGHGMSISKDGEYEALDRFNRVADEIRERLEKEKEAKHG